MEHAWLNATRKEIWEHETKETQWKCFLFFPNWKISQGKEKKIRSIVEFDYQNVNFLCRTVILRQRLCPGFHRVIEVRRFLITYFLKFLKYFISTADDSMNTTQCHSCLEDDFDLCVNRSEIQNCTSPATDSCFSAAGRYKFANGSTAVFPSVARGCISCPSKIMFVQIIVIWAI